MAAARLPSSSSAPLRAVRVVAGALGLGVVVYASAHPSQWVWAPPQWNLGSGLTTPPPEPSQSPMPGMTLPPDSGTSWDWLPMVLAILAGLAILALLARLIYRVVKALLAARIAKLSPADHLGAGAGLPGVRFTPQEVTDVVEEALHRLDAAPTTEDAVILAWLAFEEAAGRHGMARHPAQTATEFTAEVLEQSAVPVADTVLLRGLYHRARFSTAAIGTAEVQQARQALEHIARVLEGRHP